MVRLYYLNHECFEEGDTKRAFQFAKELIKKNGDIDTLTFLVCQRSSVKDFLGEIGISEKDFKKPYYCISQTGITVQVQTLRTYNPGYAMASGKQKYELLISVGVPPKKLEKYIEKSRVKYWIIVPWQLTENEQLLNIFEAVDIETGERRRIEDKVAPQIRGAVEWLKSTSYPNQGYIHSSDSNRLKSMANAVKVNKIPFNYESLLHYCLHHGMTYSAAKKTADCFKQASTHRKFAVTGDYTPADLLKQMNRTDFQQG